MSELAEKLFETVRLSIHAVAPGLKDLVPEAKQEFSRLGRHGATELASALFTGNAFVLYGHGRNTSSVETPSPEMPSPTHEQEAQQRGGMER